MDNNVIVGLLTAAVILLSLVIVVLLAVVIVVLLKVKYIVNNIHTITGNVASISAWFSPAKVLREARRAIKR